MKSRPFLRLAWRPATLWWLFVFFGFSTLLAQYVPIALHTVSDLLGGGDAALDPAAEKARAKAQALTLVGILAPASLGMIVGQMVRELLHTTVAWSLPKLRSRMAFELVAVGAFVAFLATFVHVEFGGELGWQAAAGLGGLAFGVGLLVLDPYPRSLVSLAAAFLLLGALFGVDSVTAGLQRAGWFAPVIGAAGLVGAVLLKLGKAGARERARIPCVSFLNSFQPGYESAMNREMSIRNEKFEKPWRLERVGRSLSDWLRVGLYENYGWYSKGWLGIALVFALGSLLIVSIFSYEDGYSRESSPRTGLMYVYHTLLRPDERPEEWGKPPSTMMNSIIAGMVLMHGMTSSLVLRRGWPYPLSRADRARQAWWGMILHSTAFVVLILSVYGLVALGARSLAGFEAPATSFPHFVRAGVLAWMLMPPAAYIGFRFLSYTQQKKSPGTYIAILLGLAGVFVAAVGFLSVLWGRYTVGSANFVWLGVVLAIALCLQQYLRLQLRSWYLRGDLV